VTSSASLLKPHKNEPIGLRKLITGMEVVLESQSRRRPLVGATAPMRNVATKRRRREGVVLTYVALVGRASNPKSGLLKTIPWGERLPPRPPLEPPLR